MRILCRVGRSQLDPRQIWPDLLIDPVSSELEGMKRDHDYFRDTVAIKDKQIAF